MQREDTVLHVKSYMRCLKWYYKYNIFLVALTHQGASTYDIIPTIRITLYCTQFRLSLNILIKQFVYIPVFFNV